MQCTINIYYICALQENHFKVYLDRRFSRDVGNQEIHGNILTVHVFIYSVSYDLRHPVHV